MKADSSARRALFRVALFAVCSVSCKSSAPSARVLYVDQQHGDDRNNGAIEHPFHSIQRAASLARPSDTVMIRAGIYRETVTPVSSGTASAPIVFQAAPGEAVFQPLYDVRGVFAAKSMILKQPRAELVKYLDVPGFAQGDLFYIQNLIETIEAPGSP